MDAAGNLDRVGLIPQVFHRYGDEHEDEVGHAFCKADGSENAQGEARHEAKVYGFLTPIGRRLVSVFRRKSLRDHP